MKNKLATNPHCPSCNKQLDGFTPAGSAAAPSPGDVSICVYCGQLLQFTESMMLKKADPQALLETNFTELQKVQRVAQSFRRELKPDQVVVSKLETTTLKTR